MEIKEIILMYITLTGFISYVPQIMRLIKTKSADDCSVSTWTMWLVNTSLYLLYLLYLYLDNVSILLKLTQLVEVGLIAITTVLIVILRIREWSINRRHLAVEQ